MMVGQFKDHILNFVLATDFVFHYKVITLHNLIKFSNFFLGGIIGAIAGVGGILKCKAEDVASDIRLQDEGFVRQQLDCVLDEGPCDDLGATIKRKSKRSYPISMLC